MSSSSPNKIVDILNGEISKVINQISQDYHINKAEMLHKYLPAPSDTAIANNAFCNRTKTPSNNNHEHISTKPARTTDKPLPHIHERQESHVNVTTPNFTQSFREGAGAETDAHIAKKRKKRKRRTLHPKDICMARKQDGHQCTRRRKLDCDYCGKHMKSRKFGRIDDPIVSSAGKSSKAFHNTILTWVELFGDTEYLVDDNDIVYTNNASAPTIIGRRIHGDCIELLSDLSLE